MTITYTYQFRFFPKQWKPPIPPETENMQKILEFRQLIACYLKDWLSVLHTWRMAIKYSVPLLPLAYLLGIFGWLTLLILSFIVAILTIVIWVKIKIFHRRVSYIQIMVDEIIFCELGVRLPRILEND